MEVRETLARRIRETRRKRKMTLKEVEQRSGLSSTHISEIERGRTIPTISALERLARALDRDPTYFLESRELEEIDLTTAEPGERPGERIGNVEVENLSRGVLGAQLALFRVRAQGRFQGRLAPIGAGDLATYVFSGTVRIREADQEFALMAGDSLHATFAESPAFQFEQAPTELFVVVDPSRSR